MDFKANDFIDETPSLNSETYTGADLYAMSSQTIPTLIDPIVPSEGLWSLVGSSDTGKSMLLRQLVVDIAQGKDFLNFRINSKYKKAIFIATEDDAVSTSYLLRKQTKDPAGLENIRFHFEVDNIPDYLTKQLELEAVDLVIIDAWSDVFGQNLNDSALIRQTLNKYKSIASKFKCSIGFLHHTGKRTQKLVPSKDNILSGQGFEAKMRLVIELRNDAKDENYRHLCIVKGNYLGREYKNSSYKLEFNPDTFLFTATGERVPFDELAEVYEENGFKKPSLLKPHEINESEHLKILQKIFKNDFKPKLSELQTRIANKYNTELGTVFGAKRVDAYLDYLLHDLKLIAKEGKDRSPKAYYYLTTPPLTEPGTELKSE